MTSNLIKRQNERANLGQKFFNAKHNMFIIFYGFKCCFCYVHNFLFTDWWSKFIQRNKLKNQDKWIF